MKAMNKNNLASVFLLAFSVSAAVSLSGCRSTGTSTGDPFVASSLVVTNSAQPATIAKSIFHPFFDLLVGAAVWAKVPPSLRDAANRTVVLSAHWIRIKDIEFETDELTTVGEIDGDEVRFAGPYAIDLLSATPGSLGTSEIPQRGYRRIKMKLTKEATVPSGAPAGLANRSIYLEASVAGTAFTVALSEETELQISGANAVTPSNLGKLVVVIRSANLFRKIDLAAVTAGLMISENTPIAASNPCPLIDSSAADLYTCFRKGFESEANFGKDENGDDDLTGGEQSVD